MFWSYLYSCQNIELNLIELNKGLLKQNTSGSQKLKYACLQKITYRVTIFVKQLVQTNQHNSLRDVIHNTLYN